MIMEWTGRQQLYFLLQSVGVGLVQGLVLDTLTGLRQRLMHKRWRLTDVLFGPIAAFITFIGALVIMDGQLHPMLFFGIAIGMLVEHATVGLWLQWLMRRLRVCVHKGVRLCVSFLRKIGRICGKNQVFRAIRKEKREKE